MNKNIEAVYEKHFNLFPRGSLASLETDIVYQGHEYQDIARNLQLENGVDLVSLKMFAEALQNNPRLELRYKRY